MKKMIFKTLRSLAIISFLGFTVPALATTLIHKNLAGLIVDSERIFVGECISVQEREIEFSTGSIWYTEYRFEVIDRIKGNFEGIVTIRQYGLVKPRQIGENRLLVSRIPAMPVYNENQKYLLFLRADSRFGLTSPIGLYQGAFLITHDQYGKEVAVNGIMNRGLFEERSSKSMNALDLTQSERQLAAKREGPFIAKDLISVVKKLVKSY